MRRKKFIMLLLICVMTLGLAACGSSGTGGQASSNGGASGGSSGGTSSGEGKGQEAPKSWAEEVGLHKTETVEELYEKAKQEGKVVIYSMSGRLKDVKETFEKKYPGITVEPYKIGSTEIAEKLLREQDAGVYNADIVFTKDTSGAVFNDFVKPGRVHMYLPNDIKEKMVEPYKSRTTGYVPYVELRGIFYNSEVNQTPPITNWWDLTEPEWKGKFMISDPLSSADTMDLFISFIKHADDMAQAYKEKYGKDVELNGTENAGYEFIKRLVENDIVLVKSGGDITTAIGRTGQAKPPVGLAVSSKLRGVQEQGLKISVSYDIKPAVSNTEEALLYIADKAPHPNAAKLFIRWMVGEADGKGEGFRPFDVNGSWSTRTDQIRDDQPSLEEIKVWPYDGEFAYENYPKVRNFWLKLQ